MTEQRGQKVVSTVLIPVPVAEPPPPPPPPDARPRPTALLTSDEHRAIELACELRNVLARVVGEGRTRSADLNELVGHIHTIQQAVMSQAAARAYPDRYRLLGEELR